MSKQSRPRGSINEVAKGKWRIRVYTGKHPVTGKPRYHDETIKGKKKDANSLLAKIAHKLDEGQYTRATKKTVGQVFDEWLKLHRTKVSPRTADWYQNNFDKYARERIGGIPISKLATEQLEDFYAELHGKFTPVTIHAIHRGIAAALRWATRRGIVARPATEDIELPKIKRKKRPTLTPEQAVKLLKACDEVSGGLIVEFALLTGMRPEEYLATRWQDVNLKKGTARVEQVLIRHKGKMSFEKPKTESSYRTIPLPASLTAKLKTHRTSQLERKMRAGELWQDYDLVFCATLGKPLHHNNVSWQIFKKILRKAKLPDIRLYDLRHSQATLLLIEGEHLKVVSERLGHSSIKITGDVYSHVQPGMQEEATRKLEKLLYS